MKNENEERVDISTYISIVLRRKWLILILFLATFISTVYFTFRKPPVYEAKATIIIKQLPSAFPGMEFGYTKAAEMTNHTLILKSNSVMEKVSASFRPEEIESLGIEERSAIAGKIRKATTITPIKNSDIIEITCKTEKPYTAALFANQIANTYIQFNIEDKRREVSGVREFAEAQMKKVEEQLKKSEEDIRGYQKQHKVLGLQKETEEFISQIADLQSLYEKAKIERMGVEKNLAAIKSQLTSEQKEFLKTSTDISLPLLSDLKKSLSTLENDRASLVIQGYGGSDPKIKGIDNKIAAIKHKMNEVIVSLLQNRGQIDALTQVQSLILQSLSLQIEVEVTKARENAFRGILSQYEARFKRIPDNQIELARLERQRTANEKVYMMLLEKSEEAKISEASEIGTVSLLDKAVIPQKQLWKKKILNIVLGFIMGLIISLGVAFIIEYFDTSIKDIEDVEEILKLPILASIPTIKADRKKGEIEDIRNRLITHYRPRSPISESYRSLRTSLRFASIDGGIKTVVLTSPAPKEGKTLTASNLAITEAQAGRKTLLLDTDLRRPMVHHLFNLKKEDGISKVLTDELKLNDAIKKTGVENLYAITSGFVPPNPSELLGSKKMKNVLEELKEKFDMIILDSPPIIAVTDPVVIGQEVDGMVMVIRSGRTTRDIAEKAKNNAEYVHIKLLGVVLNDIDVRNVYGSSRYYYYKYYHYYSEDGEKGSRRL